MPSWTDFVKTYFENDTPNPLIANILNGFSSFNLESVNFLISLYTNYLEPLLLFETVNYLAIVWVELLNKVVTEFVTTTAQHLVNSYLSNSYFSGFLYGSGNTSILAETENYTENSNRDFTKNASRTNTQNNQNLENRLNINSDSTINNILPTPVNDVLNPFTNNNGVLENSNNLNGINLNKVNTDNTGTLNTANNSEKGNENETNKEVYTTSHNNQRQEGLRFFNEFNLKNIFHEWNTVYNEIMKKYRAQIFTPFTVTKHWFF